MQDSPTANAAGENKAGAGSTAAADSNRNPTTIRDLMKTRFASSASGTNVYLQLYTERMATSPAKIYRFADPDLPAEERQTLLQWLRDVDDQLSMQSLQILFAFSVPCPEALGVISDLKLPVVSAGAGAGYWECLLASTGVSTTAFDANDRFPETMRYCTVETGGAAMLARQPEDSVLLMAWPDADESSTFGVDCVRQFRGRLVAHVGELLGETASSHPWGQTTSSACQLLLAERFRCVRRVALPRWPGNWDALTLWRRVPAPVPCDGAFLHHVSPVQ